MEHADRRAEHGRVAAHLVQRDEAVVDIERGVLDAFRHDRPGRLLEAHDELGVHRAFLHEGLHVEALALIEGLSADISVPQVLKEFGIPTSKELIANSARLQSAKRIS